MQSFGGKFVPRKDLAALLTGLGMPEKELEAWLGMLLAAVGGAHAKSSLVDAMKQATAGDRSGCMFSLDALLRIYPAFAPLRLERAIQLDTNGQSRAAWDEMTAALQLDSGNGLAWQSAGVILNRLGLRDDAMMAAATAYVIQNGSEA
jgi:Flp pilus assembly protein TadD